MDSHSNITVTHENFRFVFDGHPSKTIIPFSGFPPTGTRNYEALFSSLLSVLLFSNPVPTGTSSSEKFQRHSGRNGDSACRKQLSVRGVRKASLALIFLTPLTLHPYILQVWMYLFVFSAGGNGRGELSNFSWSPLNEGRDYVDSR